MNRMMQHVLRRYRLRLIEARFPQVYELELQEWEQLRRAMENYTYLTEGHQVLWSMHLSPHRHNFLFMGVAMVVKAPLTREQMLPSIDRPWPGAGKYRWGAGSPDREDPG